MTTILNASGAELLAKDSASVVWAIPPGGSVHCVQRGAWELGTSNGVVATVTLPGVGASTITVPAGISGAEVVSMPTGPEAALIGFGAVLGMGGTAWCCRIIKQIIGGATGYGRDDEG